MHSSVRQAWPSRGRGCTVYRMTERETDREFDPWGHTGPVKGRRFVPREGRNEFMQPTWWNNGWLPATVIGGIFFLGVVALIIYSA